MAVYYELVHQVPAASLPDQVVPLPFGTVPLRENSVLLHRDLHPQNVILTANGPMIIDWEGAIFGPAVADIAMTWVIIGFSDVPLPRVQAYAARGLQALFTRAFLRAAGPVDEYWRAAAVRHRLTDPHLLPSEAARLAKLAPA